MLQAARGAPVAVLCCPSICLVLEQGVVSWCESCWSWPLPLHPWGWWAPFLLLLFPLREVELLDHLDLAPSLFHGVLTRFTKALLSLRPHWP